MPRRSGSNIGRRTRKAQMIFNRRRLNRPVEEHSTDNVEEHPTDTVEEHPRDNVEEHSTDHKEEYSTDSVEEHSTDNVEEHSTDNVNLRDQVRANFKRWLEEHYVSAVPPRQAVWWKGGCRDVAGLIRPDTATAPAPRCNLQGLAVLALNMCYIGALSFTRCCTCRSDLIEVDPQ
ncbi:hypothetical protein J6590_008744 [Homalodisca vitripennis]|nr:hypothetical protein J6590_008744 [Homalodisca vitripennis]